MLTRKNIEPRQNDDLLRFLGIKKGATGVIKLTSHLPIITPIEIKVDDGEGGNLIFNWTLSTFDLDRHEEKIDPTGWEIDQFLLNPVVEWAHDYSIPAIGRIESLRIEANGLNGTIIFNEKAYDPFGWSIGQRVKAGVLRAGSVGFRAMEIEIPPKDGEAALIFRKQELLEFSICNVPANAMALVQMQRGRKEQEGKLHSKYPPFWGDIINTGGMNDE